MNVEQIMTREPRCIGPDESLETAAKLMWENDCGSLPVVDADGRALAMVTDRDLCMHAWSQGRALRELSVRGAMSPKLVACAPGDPLARAEALMAEHQLRRLPVLDGQRRVLGLLSLNDLARETAQEHGRRHPEIADRDVANTLAAICRPHTCHLPAGGLRTAAPRQASLAGVG